MPPPEQRHAAPPDQPQRMADQQARAHPFGLQPPVPHRVVEQPALEVGEERLLRREVGADAAEVHERRLGQPAHVAAGLAHAFAEVLFFVVHPEPLVESADALQHAAADQEHAAADAVDLGVGDRRALGEQRVDEQRLRQRVPRQVPAPRGALRLAVLVDDARAEHGGVGVSVGGGEEAFDLGPRRLGIGVEQQHPAAVRAFEPAVDAVGEAAVLRLGQHDRVGERRARRRDAVVIAQVVDDDHLARHRRREQAAEQAEQQVARVPVDDDDRQDGGVVRRCAGGRGHWRRHHASMPA